MKLLKILPIAYTLLFLTGAGHAQDDLEQISSSLYHNTCNSVVKFGNYAYIGGEYGLHVVDISDSTAPVFVNCLRGSGLTDIDIAEGSDEPRLYSRNGTSLRIIDITDRENPVIAGEYQTDLGNIQYFDVVGNYAYLAAESSYYSWVWFIEVVDVRDPVSPSSLSYTSTRHAITSLDAVGGRVYTSFNMDLNPTGMQIFDVSDPEFIHLIGTLEFTYYTTWEAAPYGDYAYIGSPDGILVVDINNLSDPFGIDPYPLWDFTFLRVFDHYLFAYGGSAVFMLDVIEPTQPVLLSTYSPPYTVSDIFWEGDFLYHSAVSTSGRISGMNIVDYSDNQNPELIGRYEIPGELMAIHVSGDFAFVATGNTGMFPVNVSDPYNPLVGENVINGSAVLDIVVSGQYAYLAAWDDGLAIFDISNPEFPELVGTYIDSAVVVGVDVEGEYAYLICARDGYYDYRIVIVDISYPANPTLLSTYRGIESPRYLTISNGIAYVSNYDSLIIVDMTDPASPTRLGSHPYVNVGYDLAKESNFVYVAGWPEGLQIFDISSSENPILVGVFDSFGAWKIDAYDNYACLGNSNGVHLLDVSDPAEPALISTYGEAWPNNIYMQDEYVYVAAKDCLIILKITPTGLEEAGAIQPDSFLILQNYPNPFNPSTTIRFALPEQVDVRIEIYNILGQKVATLFDGNKQAGYHAVTWQADDYSSGVYFARLETGKRAESIKMVLVK